MYRNILVAIEHSAADAAVLAHVEQLARLTHAELLLVHVADGWAARHFEDLELRESEEIVRDRAYLEQLCSGLGERGITARGRIAFGDPATELIKVSGEAQVDLIAMSTHGHRFLNDLIRGSTADRVRHRVTVPVLMVRAAVFMMRAWLAGLAARDRAELTLLLAPIGALALVLAFVLLAGEVFEGDTQAFDDRVLMALRRADNPALPIGPRWLQAVALDITALGSATVLGLVLVAVSGFLLLQGKVRTAAFITVATLGGFLLNSGLKLIFQRARPDIVPHLRDVMTLSFPSGHAMTAAAVYLTLGALSMRSAQRPVAKFYCMAMAMLVTLLVGASRVFLGVHYPSDVLAGWILGLVWALICWTVERGIEYRAGLKAEEGR